MTLLPTPEVTPRPYAHSNATRLLSAGVYLQRGFRASTIKVLLKERYRIVAPSYGYDAVTVLAHALAARSLRNKQLVGVAVGLLIDAILMDENVIGVPGGILLALWLPWALAFLRRVATMQAMLKWLRPNAGTSSDGAFPAAFGDEGEEDFPTNNALTPVLLRKIAQEQAGAQDQIYYGGYHPFVGAGWPQPDWSMAELLIAAKPSAFEEYARSVAEDDDEDDEPEPPREVVPFTVDEITDYVAQRLQSDLHDEAPYGEQVENLTVVRQKYNRAGWVPVKKRLLWRLRGVKVLPPDDAADFESFRLIDERERYDASREVLSVRVGSWDQEVVTSIFISFDLRGNTLYSEFHPHVMPPVIQSFHLVDRLPSRLGPKLLLRMAWHIPLGLPSAALREVRGWYFAVKAWASRIRHAVVGNVEVVDGSEFRLGRYAVDLVDRGAVTSLRELAALPVYHQFFQEHDADKYVKIVERRLLAIMRDFLDEHNVDLGDHDARQTNILDASTHNYEATIVGDGTINQGGRRVSRAARRRAANGGAGR